MTVERGVSDLDLAAFRREVDEHMKRLYGIDWQDASGDAEPLIRAITGGQSAESFVRRWGEKYDLTPVSEWLAFPRPRGRS